METENHLACDLCARLARLTSHAIYVRDWLTYEETVSLSEYAGYDLTEI